MADFTQVIETLIAGDIEKLGDLVKKALDDKIAAKEVLNEAQRSMDEAMCFLMMSRP